MRIIIITETDPDFRNAMAHAIRITPPIQRLPGIAITVALHAAALAAALSYAPAREALLQLTPVMVSLLPPAETPRPVIPHKPRVQPVKAPAATATAAPPRPLETAPAAGLAAVVAPAVPVETRSAEPSTPPPVPAVTQPRFDADYLNNPAPPYPALSRRLGETGRVMLRVLVDRQGLPERIELRSSSGFERLDKTALDTVKRWKFVPARRGDEAVSEWVLVPISFSLRS